MAARLLSYLNQNGILSKWQFGFRSGHSTVHPMVHFLNKITESLNKKKHTIAIFCDLKNAFDTCDHNILLLKLKRYGISGTELQWFETKTIFKHKKSLELSSGDFTVLPLLFILHINDLPLSSKFLSLLFADDTTLQLTHDNLKILTVTVNEELGKVCEYFRINKNVLHPEKTKFMLFTRGAGGVL